MSRDLQTFIIILLSLYIFREQLLKLKYIFVIKILNSHKTF